MALGVVRRREHNLTEVSELMTVTRAVGLVVVACLFAASCGSDQVSPREPTVTTEPSDSQIVVCTEKFNLVPADQVVVFGDLTEDQEELVSWALQRYSLAGLDLPAELTVSIDPTGDLCKGAIGLCHPDTDPPGVVVCMQAGGNAYRTLNHQMTLLHELAHLWHLGEIQQGRLVDPSPIVGGLDDYAVVPWEERPRERLAVVMTWGLMDQLRRPVPTLPTQETPYAGRVVCAEMFIQFQALTGLPPLEPIQEVCRPPT